MAAPKLSVCIPTYNYAEYIDEALNSILIQSFRDFEVIIVDDASTDDTVPVLERHVALQDPRFRFVVNNPNRGMVANWNYCLELAQGKYIKFLFADDYLTTPDALATMVATLDQHPAVSLVSSSRQFVSAESKVNKILSHYKHDCFLKGTTVIEQCLRQMKNLIGEPSAVMFRRCDAERGFNLRYRQLVDLEMWFHLLERGDFAYFVKPLCSFRTHDKQQTVVNRGIPETIHETGWLHDEYLSKPYIKIGLLARQYLLFDYRYQIWKGHKKHGFHEDYRFYDSVASKVWFYLLLSCYKIVKPLVKLLLKQGYGK